MSAPGDKPPIYGPEEIVFETPWQSVRKLNVSDDGKARTLYVTDYGARACVLLSGPMGILLTRQYRYIIRDLSYEVPGGKIESSEEVESGARRECLEETGFRCGPLQHLITFQPGLDTLRNPTHVFLCSQFEAISKGPAHADEVKGLEWKPLAECIQMIQGGRIVDSLSVIALLYYARLLDGSVPDA